MSYVALYRRWRPKVFEDVVGQGHIVKTLKNQIKNDNIAHAYLFCGTRGTGKTSTAKIFARAVNCINPDDYNPCNVCEVCSGILNESIIDVIEIDAASNNSVDDIRDLRENVKYPPTKGRYKVYIIDEVHMLSTGAFNALLKTLEEPPSFVIFILATTEPHKIPATILSRCQRFDFKRVKEEDMVKRLAYICNAIHVDVKEEALRLIARNSDGAMRDALSILDQCVSFCLEKIDYDDVIQILGMVNDDVLFQMIDCIIKEDAKGAMELVEKIVDMGKDLYQFIKDMIGHYRNLMMTKVSQNLEGIINLSKESIHRLIEQGKKLEMDAIIRAIHVLSQTEADAKWSTQSRVLLEVAIMKLIRPALDDSNESLIERINKLEEIIQKGSIKIEKSEEKEEIIKVEESSLKPRKINPPNFEILKKTWDTILKEIKKRKISVHAVLMEGELIRIKDQSLFIAFKDGYGFHKEAVSNSSYKDFIEDVITEMTGQKLHLQCFMEDEIKGTGEEAASDADEEVQKIIELFGENLVEVIEE